MNRNTTACEAVLFDLDGTLVDTAADLALALNLLLVEIGHPRVELEFIRPYVSGGANEIIRAGIGASEDGDLVASLRPRYLELYLENICQESRLFPGMSEVLSRLEYQALKWGVVTNKPAAYTGPLMDAMNLSARCCSIVSADTTAHKKPHPEPLLYACRQCGITPRNSLYIGDDKRDIQAGKAAGMQTAAALWGYIQQNDRVESWQADAIISQPKDILTLL